jgi:two-component sensor histidine kinase
LEVACKLHFEFAECRLGLLQFPSYQKTHALIAKTDNGSPDAAQRRLRWGIFFAGWTAFVALAVWWLVRRAGAASASPGWFIEGDVAANASLAERIANWLKLADLNFHHIYPWILLAPYVAWLGAHFLLEHGRWRVSLPAHLAGCVLFALACHALATYADWWRPVLVTVGVFTDGTGFKQEAVPNSGQTNGFTISTNASMARRSALWGGAGSAQSALPPLPAIGQGGPGGTWPASGKPDLHSGVILRKRFLGTQLDLFDPFAYAVLVGIVHTVHFYRRSKEREGRAAALEAQLTQARLTALQAQLHPHFLFNALNAISTLLRRDTRAAQDALASFSELLRLALCHSTEPEVTLREDLEFLRRYVEIQQTRLGDRLHVEEIINPEALDCLVPALFLQPLVENAIRHGLEPSADPGVVRVIVQPQGERLLLTVEDNGAGLSNKENERGGGIGIGLQNLRSRLKSLYGAGQRIDVGPRPEGGVTVHVEIPLHQAHGAEIGSGVQ